MCYSYCFQKHPFLNIEPYIAEYGKLCLMSPLGLTQTISTQ